MVGQISIKSGHLMAPWPLISEIVRQPCCQAHRAGWPCHPVFVTLGLAHDQHLSIIKIHVLDAQSQTLHELGKMGVGVHEAKNMHTTTVSSPLTCHVLIVPRAFAQDQWAGPL